MRRSPGAASPTHSRRSLGSPPTGPARQATQAAAASRADLQPVQRPVRSSRYPRFPVHARPPCAHRRLHVSPQSCSAKPAPAEAEVLSAQRLFIR